MKDSEFSHEKARIKRVKQRWLQWLLPGWSLMTHYCDDREDMPSDVNKEAIAACRARSEYLQADIYWYMPLVKEVDEEELERVAVHEMGHAMVAEMRHRGIEHEERVVTELTRSLFWIRDNADNLKGEKPMEHGKKGHMMPGMTPKGHGPKMMNDGAKHTSAKPPKAKRTGVGKRRK